MSSVAAAPVVDLHAHLAMHLRPWPAGGPRRASLAATGGHLATGLLGRLGNLDAGRPRVSLPALRRGGVGVACSVAWETTTEIPLSPLWWARHLRGPEPYHWAPPSPAGWPRLLAQLDLVESRVAAHPEAFALVRDAAGLDAALASGRTAVVHAVEGAFHLGPDPDLYAERLRLLARRGVAYLTVAHLGFRGIASISPAWLQAGEARFERLWPQPPVGLSARGRAAVLGALEAGIALDLTHLGPRALAETLALLDAHDPGGRLPVLFSHGAPRRPGGGLAYNPDADTVRRIAARGGTVGLIASAEGLADGAPPPRTPPETADLVATHVETLRALTGADATAAIGTDLGGFITPAPGLATAAGLAWLRGALAERLGPERAAAVLGGNALRLLRRVLAR